MTRVTACLLAGAGGLGLAVAVTYFYGLSLPGYHTATVEELVPAPVDVVRARVIDWRDPSWREPTATIEDLGLVSGRQRFRECTDDCMEFEIVPWEGGFRSRIVNNDMFWGSWSWTFEAEGPGTRVTVTEQGTVPSPILRVLMRHGWGEETNIRLAITSLRRTFEK